jgi:glyceraldehyde 3-phosphate dehydrogenase
MAPVLLPWLSVDRFFVCYTLIPYTGPSMIDFRFRLGSRPHVDEILRALVDSDSNLRSRYDFPLEDRSIRSVLGQPYNAVIPHCGIKRVGDNVLLRAYFDNENSAVRYLELVNLAADFHADAFRCGSGSDLASRSV